MRGSRIGRALDRLLGGPAPDDVESARWRASVDRRLDELLHLQRALLKESKTAHKDEDRWRWRFRHQVDALLRLQALDGTHLPAPLGFEARHFHLRAQNEEDGLILALLEATGVTTRRFVEARG